MGFVTVGSKIPPSEARNNAVPPVLAKRSFRLRANYTLNTPWKKTMLHKSCAQANTGWCIHEQPSKITWTLPSYEEPAQPQSMAVQDEAALESTALYKIKR